MYISDNLACSYSFRPYQLVPSSYEEEPIKFIHSAGTHFATCNFSNALVKYPSQKTWVRFPSISEGHIDINMTSVGVLLFRVSYYNHAMTHGV